VSAGHTAPSSISDLVATKPPGVPASTDTVPFWNFGQTMTLPGSLVLAKVAGRESEPVHASAGVANASAGISSAADLIIKFIVPSF